MSMIADAPPIAEPVSVPPSKDMARYKAGSGHWQAVRETGFDIGRIATVSTRWRDALRGVSRPWLCWKVDDEWCVVQQKLVQSAGWTPVVGFDPRSGPPKTIVGNAILIDFNAGLDFPVMYPHFPLEFMFMFCDRLAFWHSDLLLRKDFMKDLAERFELIPDGRTVVTNPRTSRRYMFSNSHKRYWELVGCTTRGASRKQFEAGAGWWKSFFAHPNCPNQKEYDRRKGFHQDHGGGIYYWHKYCGGDVAVLNDQDIFDGHFTKIGNPNYKRQFTPRENVLRLMSAELTENFDIRSACAKMGLEDLL
jgi:hypothetical protein